MKNNLSLLILLCAWSILSLSAQSQQLSGPSPAPSLQFDGPDQGNTTVYTAGIAGAVGPNHVMTIRNSTGINAQSIYIYNKTGQLVGTKSFNDHFYTTISGFIDPRVVFDHKQQRWIASAIATYNGNKHVCVMRSKTADPTAGWDWFTPILSFFSSVAQPKIGFSDNWITISCFYQDGFANGSTISYVWKRQDFYSGTSSTYWSDQFHGMGHVCPVTTYDAGVGDLYLVSVNTASGGKVRVFRIFGSPSNAPQFDLIGVQISGNNAWSSTGPGGPQLGTSTGIAIPNHQMASTVYRNGSIWFAHNVFLPSSGANRAVVQWGQVVASSNTLAQLGRIDGGSPSLMYGYPSIAVDGNNNVLVGFNQFSSSGYASSAYAYHYATDPSGYMNNVYTYKNGVSTFTQAWGNYSATVVDPVENAMWTLQQYVKSNNKWGTQWAKVGGSVPCNDPCGTTGSEWIDGISINNAAFDTPGSIVGGCVGFHTLGAYIAVLKKGVRYPITLTPGFSGAAQSEYWKIWMDLNHDGDFDDPGDLVYATAFGSTIAIEDSLMIPITSITGPTSMRVAMRRGSPPPDCGNFTFGQVLDYSQIYVDDYDYCDISFTNACEYEYIKQVSINTINNSSGCGASGYQDFTNLTTTLNAGDTYQVQLTPGFYSIPLPERWLIWIDFNKDLDFDDPGENVFDSGLNGSPAITNGFIEIPFGVQTTSTRMRIKMIPTDVNANPFPCDPITIPPGLFTDPFGEVEDYTVNIQGITASFDPPVLLYNSDGGTQQVQFTTNAPSWSFSQMLSSMPGILNVSPSSGGPGTFSISITIDANYSVFQQIGEAIFVLSNGQALGPLIIQYGQQSAISVNPSVINCSPNGETVMFTVSANDAWTSIPTPLPDLGWVHFVGGGNPSTIPPPPVTVSAVCTQNTSGQTNSTSIQFVTNGGATTTLVINQLLNNLAATAAQTQGILCHNWSSGVITVTASGLNGIYTYSLNGGSSQNGNVFSGLPPGTYTVVVTGQFGNTVSTAPVTLSNPPALSINTSVACDDVTITASGGTGMFTYSIDGINVQSGNQFFNLPNGNYLAYVLDANGCTTTKQVSIANTLMLSAQINHPKCSGGTDGKITATANGGPSPYIFSLNGGPSQGSNVFNNLAAGNYTIVVTDNNGCSAASNALVLINPTPLQIVTNVVQNTINVQASGGTGFLMYSIDGINFQVGNQFVNVPNGTYTVTVRDGNGCKATSQATVNVLSGMVQSSGILCFGGVASILIIANGGTPPYQYSLNNGTFQTSNSFSNLGVGTYTIRVRDASNAVIVLGPIVIQQPSQLGTAATITCNDATLNISGGTPPYTYISNSPAPDLQNLPNGAYQVTVTDSNGCTISTSFSVNVPVLGLSSSTDSVKCFGGNTGAVIGSGFGGCSPYTYSLNGSPFLGNNVFANLSANSYSLAVKDSEGNLSSAFPTVFQPVLLALIATPTGNTITASASGGAPPYSYSLNGGPTQNNGVFGSLDPGSYTIVVTDTNGCLASVPNIMVISGTIELAEVWGVTVSPNPSNGLFRLTVQKAPERLFTQMYDMTGRLLKSFEFQAANGQLETTLDLQAFPNGPYMLLLNDGKIQGSLLLNKADK